MLIRSVCFFRGDAVEAGPPGGGFIGLAPGFVELGEALDGSALSEHVGLRICPCLAKAGQEQGFGLFILLLFGKALCEEGPALGNLAIIRPEDPRTSVEALA